MSKANKAEVIGLSTTNGNLVGCIDGRKVAYIGKKSRLTGKYTFYPEDRRIRTGLIQTAKVKDVNYPQVLGGAFGFVAFAEKKMGLKKDAAFRVVQKAFKKAGYLPSFHVDDHHGSLSAEYQNLSKSGRRQELAHKILDNLTGCGYLAYNWKADAPEYAKEAVKRGWVVQVLTGEHDEKQGGAHLNYKKGTSFDVTQANEAGKPRFNQDMWFVALILQHMLAETNENHIFIEEALEWFEQTFAAVVILLGGVETADDIQEHQ